MTALDPRVGVAHVGEGLPIVGVVGVSGIIAIVQFGLAEGRARDIHQEELELAAAERRVAEVDAAKIEEEAALIQEEKEPRVTWRRSTRPMIFR